MKKYRCVECGTVNEQLDSSDEFHCVECDVSYRLEDVFLLPVFENCEGRQKATIDFIRNVMHIDAEIK